MAGMKKGLSVATALCKSLRSSSHAGRTLTTATSISGHGAVRSEIFTSHTDKWMQNKSIKSPMELINEVAPIKVEGRIVACEGDDDPALGHPVEFICLDLEAPAICKYCGLRYVQDHGHHHH